MIKNDFIFVGHILESIENIESFTHKVSKQLFIENIEKQSAIVRQIEIIGEAAKNISPSFREEHKDIEWKKIAGFRDVVIHKYFDVNLDIVWEIIKGDIPILKEKIKKISLSEQNKNG